MATVAIRVLGPVSARVDADSVDLGGPQQRTLLAALTVDAGAVVSRDRIVDRLWPDDPPPSAAKLVQKYVSGLRTAIGVASIDTVGGGYRLTVGRESIDAARFEDAVAAGRFDLATEVEWQGAPYAGCGDLPFVVAERERLERLRLEARLDELVARLELGDVSSVPELDRLATEHPEHERVAILLMRALYASERQVDALRAGRRIRQHLRDEIGVDASPELDELEQRILRHDASLHIREPFDGRTRARARDDDASDDDASVDGAGDAPHIDAIDDLTVREVRSVVLVLVVDPAPSTVPDDLLAHQERLLREVGSVAGSFGVAIERSFGDEVVVVFGVPARDDDPDRASAFAAAIRELRPNARTAVVEGDAVVTLEPDVGLVAGALLDEARAIASTASAAPAGRERTVPPDQHGSGPVGDVTDGSAYETPFEGRDDDLLAVGQMWRRVVDDGRLRVVEIVGDAGIGKTRLVSELLDRLEPVPHTVAGLGFPAVGESGFLPVLRRAVRAITPDDASLERWLARLDPAMRHRLEPRLRRILAPAASLDTDVPDEWITPVEQMYEHTAELGPMVVVIEDLHWAPADVVTRLNEVVADMSERPVLAIVTRRPHPVVDRLSGIRVAESASLHLGPLPGEAIERMANAAGSDLDPDLRRVAVNGSGGSPLFLIQFLRMLRDRPDATESGPPDSVRRVVAMRLDQLAPRIRVVIQSASLIPERVDVEAVAAITERSRDETAAAMNVLARTGLLVRRRPDDRGVTGRFGFHHSLVADVAYGQLTRVTRTELHRRAARWFGGRPQPDPDDVGSAAWHWERVLDLAHADGTPIDTSDRDAARSAIENAASQSWHVDASHALRLLRRARDLAPPGSPEQATVSMRLGEIATYGGDFETATSALADAAATFDRIGHAGAAGEALARQARAQWFLGSAHDIDELLDAAFDRLDRSPPSPSHAHAMTIAAAQTSLRGRAAEALDHVERTTPIVREHGSEQDAIRLLHVRGDSRFDLGDEQGLDDLREALRLAIDGGYGNLASQSYNNLAELVWTAEGPAESIELAQAGLDLAVASGFLGQASWHVGQICELSYDIGDWDAVTARPHTRAAHSPVVEWTVGALAARVRFWRGEDAAAEDLCAVLDGARSTQEGQVLVSILAAAIAALCELGTTGRAVDLGHELSDLARAAPQEALRASAEATRALCRLGHHELAHALLPPEQPSVLRRRLMWESSLGDVSAAQERWKEADRHYERAEEGWSAFPHPFEAAHAAWGRARASRAMGDARGATAAIRRARHRFELLGASRCVAALDAWSV